MTILERIEQLERRRFVKWAAIGAAATATAGCASHPHRYAQPMPTPESRLIELGYVLPAPLKLPPGVSLPFPWVRIVGNRALISGHGPTDEYGNLAPPLGKVGAEVTQEQAYVAASLTGLAILSSLKRELGSLDRVACWSRVFGMVASAPGFTGQPAVINGFTDLIVSVYGAERGAHARSAVGMAELPFRLPVEIEAEIELRASSA
jgi:enamine deaminase RidA (YjgF/YER057c/UK114 family)